LDENGVELEKEGKEAYQILLNGPFGIAETSKISLGYGLEIYYNHIHNSISQ